MHFFLYVICTYSALKKNFLFFILLIFNHLHQTHTMSAFSKTPPDKEFSTYHHVAYHFEGLKEHGYSKKQGFNEPADKRVLFCGFCKRLLPRYFRKLEVFKVEVFMRRFGTTGPNAFKSETLVATLYADGFQLHDVFSPDKLIEGFLKEFYASDLTDADRALALMNRATGSQHDYVWNPTGKNLEDLKTYCAHLCNFHDRSEVERFFFAMKRKHYADVPTAAPAPPVAHSTPPKRNKDTQPISSLIPAHLQPKQP